LFELTDKVCWVCKSVRVDRRSCKYLHSQECYSSDAGSEGSCPPGKLLDVSNVMRAIPNVIRTTMYHISRLNILIFYRSSLQGSVGTAIKIGCNIGTLTGSPSAAMNYGSHPAQFQRILMMKQANSLLKVYWTIWILHILRLTCSGLAADIYTGVLTRGRMKNDLHTYSTLLVEW